ncbi:gluconolaconase [Marilutibacter aestuarii]|uniref:Gluconolaconase n=1 Tax=Marilutibacter aestuarii TaxID=1706195 RepID=A0A508AEE8_9GAMM|nr:gluconolaconase [Lysobacter aestuarii]TQD46148.1 gluconolaconase [Lysobacter aestuarii]
MTRSTWLWLVVATTFAALAATFLFVPPAPLPRFEDAGPPATPIGGPSRVRLLAGEGIRGTLDGEGRRARFADPWGLALSRDGHLFVADGGEGNRIRRIAPDGTVVTLAGGREGFLDGPARLAAFDTPSGLALDLAGNLYVADTGNHAIRKLHPDGTVSTLAGNGRRGYRDGPGTEAQFDAPMGVAVDASGRVYVADTYNDRIRVIEPDGRVATLAGDGRTGAADGPGAVARFDTPTDLVAGVRGELWIADSGNGAIRHVDGGGRVSTVLADVPSVPIGLARSHDGVLHVAGIWPSRVLQAGRDGRWRVLQSDERPEARFSRPVGIAVDRRGGVFVSDAGAYRVHRMVQAGRASRRPRARAGGDPAAGEGAGFPEHGPASDDPLPATGGRWPLRPQRGWHEVVGTLGEVRGNYQGESRHHLHGGLDIRGDVGQPVLAIADAKVNLPLAAWGIERLGEGFALDTLQYIHMRVGRTPRGDLLDPERFQLVAGDDGTPARVRVRRGARFRAGDMLGTINRMAHVHLVVGNSGYERNAIALGFANFSDRVPPRIDAVELVDASGRSLPRVDGRVDVAPDAGDLQMVVEAWDQVDDNLPRRRLGLYALGYQWLDADGRPLAGFDAPRFNIEFNRMPPQDDAVLMAYAPGSGITVHGSAVTRFRYALTNTVRDGRIASGSWRPDDMAPGDYLLRVHARDYSGNEAQAGRDLPVRILPRPAPAASAATP